MPLKQSLEKINIYQSEKMAQSHRLKTAKILKKHFSIIYIKVVALALQFFWVCRYYRVDPQKGPDLPQVHI